MLHDPVNKIIHIRVDIIGDSEKSKPLDVPVNSTYYEVDTMNFYIFYGGEWVLQAVVEETEPADEDSGDVDQPAEETKSYKMNELSEIITDGQTYYESEKEIEPEEPETRGDE